MTPNDNVEDLNGGDTLLGSHGTHGEKPGRMEAGKKAEHESFEH